MMIYPGTLESLVKNKVFYRIIDAMRVGRKHASLFLTDKDVEELITAGYNVEKNNEIQYKYEGQTFYKVSWL